MIVELRRGGEVESVHRVAWALSDGTGEEPGLSVFVRSAAKPFQALPAVRAGLLGRLGLDDRHLALACASHGGTTAHVEGVREILAAAGLDEDVLECGPLQPRDPAVSLGAAPGRIHHNCSGKHALGLALCVAEGWPTQGYVKPGHPLQQAMKEAAAEATGTALDMPAGVDGCGMCTFRFGLDVFAGAFGRLAAGAFGPEVTRAMTAHPELVAYAGAIDTELMAAEPGLVAKIGAEGVLAIGLPDGRGLAIKVLDGAVRALEPAAMHLVRARLGVAADAAPLEPLSHPVVRNSLGEAVGELIVA